MYVQKLKVSVKVIKEIKIRLRHRHIGCLISTKDLKVDCQRQRPDRVAITHMKCWPKERQNKSKNGRPNCPGSSQFCEGPWRLGTRVGSSCWAEEFLYSYFCSAKSCPASNKNSEKKMQQPKLGYQKGGPLTRGSGDVHREVGDWLAMVSSVRRRRMAQCRELRAMTESSWRSAPCRSTCPPSRAEAALASLRRKSAESPSQAPVASTTSGWKVIRWIWQTVPCPGAFFWQLHMPRRLQDQNAPPHQGSPAANGAVTARPNQWENRGKRARKGRQGAVGQSWCLQAAGGTTGQASLFGL